MKTIITSILVLLTAVPAAAETWVLWTWINAPMVSARSRWAPNATFPDEPACRTGLQDDVARSAQRLVDQGYRIPDVLRSNIPARQYVYHTLPLPPDTKSFIALSNEVSGLFYYRWSCWPNGTTPS